MSAEKTIEGINQMVDSNVDVTLIICRSVDGKVITEFYKPHEIDASHSALLRHIFGVPMVYTPEMEEAFVKFRELKMACFEAQKRKASKAEIDGKYQDVVSFFNERTVYFNDEEMNCLLTIELRQFKRQFDQKYKTDED